MIGVIFKKIETILRKTPFHPQWIILRHEKMNLIDICSSIKVSVLDIGCADKKPKKYLSDEIIYYGIDYYSTATEWYNTKPDIFTDAQDISIKDESFDNVLLLDVLEHLPNPRASIKETYRVLKPSGKLILQVPFLYPIHDAPLDFHRWTKYGLYNIATEANFSVVEEKYYGEPVETACLLFNLALTKSLLNMIKSKNPLSLVLLLALPFMIVLSNLLSLIGKGILPKDKFMPLGYRIILDKNL